MKFNIAFNWKIYFALSMLFFICVSSLIVNCTIHTDNNLTFNLHSYKPGDKLDSANNFDVYSSKKITLKNLSQLESFIAPNYDSIFADNVHVIFFLVCTTAVFFMAIKNTNYGTFNAKLSKYLSVLSVTAICFVAIVSLRNLYFFKQIRSITNNEYYSRYDPQSINMIEFWIFLILTVFSYVLRKGERLQLQKDQLQKEQDLTI